MIAEIFRFLIDTLGTFFGAVLLLRAYLQFVRVHPRNPLSQFVMALTDWLVVPLRRAIPGAGGVDWASLIAAFLCALVLVLLLYLLHGSALSSFPPALIGVAFLWLVKWAVYLIMWITLLQAVISWVNPHAPIAPVLNQVTAPFLAPIRRILPLIGNVDLSPLVLFLLAQVGLFIVQRVSVSLFGMA